MAGHVPVLKGNMHFKIETKRTRYGFSVTPGKDIWHTLICRTYDAGRSQRTRGGRRRRMTVKDPVCGMELEEQDVRFTSEYQGRTYSFCSLACKKKFDENPEMYLRAERG